MHAVAECFIDGLAALVGGVQVPEHRRRCVEILDAGQDAVAVPILNFEAIGRGAGGIRDRAHQSRGRVIAHVNLVSRVRRNVARDGPTDTVIVPALAVSGPGEVLQSPDILVRRRVIGEHAVSPS